MQHYDVVVIGAGIAGSVLGRLLAEAGQHVLLVEKDEFSGKKSACGGLFDKPYFDKYVTDPAVMEQHITRNTFVMPWGSVSIDCNQVTVKRRVFDRHLADNAARAGAQLVNLTRARACRVKRAGDVEVDLQDVRTRETRTVGCRLVVFADGPHTLARNNPRFEHRQNKRLWAFACACEVDTVPFEGHEMQVYLDPALFPWGYGWIFPNKNGSNIGVGTIQTEIDRGIRIMDRLLEFMERYAPTAPVLQGRRIIERKGGFIPMRLIKRFSDDSQLVLGDAAGMVSPLFGAGIDHAIDAAEAACTAILAAMRAHDCSARRLQKYDEIIGKGFLEDLRKQAAVARVCVFSRRLSRALPIKLFAVIVFGAGYSRWNKLKILWHPLLGRPEALRALRER